MVKEKLKVGVEVSCAYWRSRTKPGKRRSESLIVMEISLITPEIIATNPLNARNLSKKTNFRDKYAKSLKKRRFLNKAIHSFS
jgi:hypothetical protein